MELSLIYTIVGFGLAGWSVIGNDSIQTLGTFIASKQKWFKWYTLAASASFVMILALAWGWYAYDGDISYGRLTRIPYQEIQWYHAVAPGILLLLTRVGIPVSTTFLVLSAFASTVVLEKMLMKSVVGYGLAAVVTDNVKMSTNPPDDNAIEEAVKIKESGKAKEIVAVTIGEDKAQETVRKALAVGADRGIHVKVDGIVEPLAVSKILQKIVDKEKPDLIFMGKQAIDDDCNQTGQMLAALLNYPQATFASKIEVKDKSLEVTREVDEGLETIEVNIPAIVTCDLRLNEPRYASLPNIMKAKKKPLEQINATDLGVDTKPRIEQIKVEEPPKRKEGIKVSSVAELIQKLKNEAKVI